VEEQLLRLSAVGPDQRSDLLAQVRRELHTLKGNSAMMGFGELQRLAHELEDRLDSLSPESPELVELLSGVDRFRQLMAALSGREKAVTAEETASAGVRVSLADLDGAMEILAELVIHKNRLADSVEKGPPEGGNGHRAGEAWEEITRFLDILGKSTDRLQEEIQRLRMVPLQILFRHLRRLVHDESLPEGKQVELRLAGGDTPIDRALLEVASDSLGHLVRNAVVHGIEPPAERQRAGKQATGSVSVTASVSANRVSIEVEDDGRGVDLQALRARMARHGIQTVEHAPLQSLLFRPGVSTRASADLSAGRGIGLSAVRSSVQSHGGHIEVASRPGSGTVFRLGLPLRVSITRALLVRTDGRDYAVPLSTVVETLKCRPADLAADSRTFQWRRAALPAVDLGNFFNTSSSPRQRGYALVIRSRDQHRALMVDDIAGIRDIVVRGLDPILGHPPGVSGSTVLGDGRAVLILDTREFRDSSTEGQR
jgi:two-component system chemotaxis sensor kinase CheA